MKNYLLLFAFVALVTCFWTTTVSAQLVFPPKAVGIHGEFLDVDDNDSPDIGVTVSGRYSAFLMWDALGHFHINFGDGGTVGDDPADFDEATLSVCDYPIIYRGKFDNEDELQSGWFIEKEFCYGYALAVPTVLITLVVHKSDPRYTGINPSSDWEHHVVVFSGEGNILD